MSASHLPKDLLRLPSFHLPHPQTLSLIIVVVDIAVGNAVFGTANNCPKKIK